MARGSSEQAILRALIEKATLTSTGRETYGGGAMALTRTGKQPLHILISPISPGNRVFPGDAAATIFLDDPETQPLVPTDVLRKLYGLSPAEARLAVLVLQGHSITEAAEIGQVSRETAKSQMSAVFAKTGTRRQGDLIRLLSNIPGNYDAGYGSF
jgi:DNA-binding CsgD family transcriptional regulator